MDIPMPDADRKRARDEAGSAEAGAGLPIDTQAGFTMLRMMLPALRPRLETGLSEISRFYPRYLGPREISRPRTEISRRARYLGPDLDISVGEISRSRSSYLGSQDILVWT